MHLFLDPQFRIAFPLSTVFGWLAGILLEGKSVLGVQDVSVVLAVVLLGGAIGALIFGTSWKTRGFLFAAFLPYVALLGQLTASYLHIRGWNCSFHAVLPLSHFYSVTAASEKRPQ
jgi:hypothetical protein